MASINLQPVPPFAVDAEIGLSIASRWKLWLRDFETFLLASGITDKKRQRALLLYQAGPQVREIFAQLSDVGGESDFALAKEKLTQYFEPQKNRRYEVYRFREQKQGEQESLDNFHTRLRNMAKVCEFHDENFEIEEQILIGGRSSRIRKRALRDPEYSLKDMLIDGRRDETSNYQAKDIESKEGYGENTHRLEMKPKKSCHNCGGGSGLIQYNAQPKEKLAGNVGKTIIFKQSVVAKIYLKPQEVAQELEGKTHLSDHWNMMMFQAMMNICTQLALASRHHFLKALT